MNTESFAIGTPDVLALQDPARLRLITQPAARTHLGTLADLLAAIPGRAEWTKHEAMMCTTAGHLTQMLGDPPDRVPLDRLPFSVSRFKEYLEPAP